MVGGAAAGRHVPLEETRDLVPQVAGHSPPGQSAVRGQEALPRGTREDIAVYAPFAPAG